MNLEWIGGVVTLSVLALSAVLTAVLVSIANTRVRNAPAGAQEVALVSGDFRVGISFLGLIYSSIISGVGLLALCYFSQGMTDYWSMSWHYAWIGVLPIMVGAIGAWAGYGFRCPSWLPVSYWVIFGLASWFMTGVCGWYLAVLLVLPASVYHSSYTRKSESENMGKLETAL